MHFFSSPTSNILSSTFAPASVAMSRSDSRDSATSTTSSTSQHCAWDIRPRSSSSFSSSPQQQHQQPTHRRTSSSSSSNWTPSPYRSCLSHACDSSSTSYLSDDDLLDLPIDVIESPVQKELSTEEQIEMLRAYREREESQTSQHPSRHGLVAKPEIWHHHQHQAAQQQQKKAARVVRFASEQAVRTSSGRRRPSGLRRS